MSNPESKLLLLFVRHSERIDQVKEKTDFEKNLIYPSIDPPITEKGKLISEHSGNQARLFIEQYQNGIYKDCADVKVICSPFLRTLQTGLYFKKGLGAKQKNLIVNNNIVHKLSKA